MNQAEHSHMKRRHILDISYNLFLQNGYTKTTIRKIIKETGVTTGTLYHFFKNKEDILATLMMEGFDNTIKMINTMTEKYDDPLLSYAVEIAAITLPLYFSKKIASLYFVFYATPQSSTKMAKIATQRLQNLFKSTTPDLKYNDYFLRVLSLKGLLQGFLSEKIYGDYNLDYLETYHYIAKLFIRTFNVPEKDINRTLKKALKIIGNNSIELFGYSSKEILNAEMAITF